jgi:outer membrane protein assembly factor BamB
MLVAAGCVGFNNPEGWGGPAVTDDFLIASTAKGKLSALDENPESGDQCDNSADDDGEGWVNEGCPRVGEKAERGRECENDTNDDIMDGIADDDKVNDGCPSYWTFPTGQEEPGVDLEAIYTTPQVIGDTVYIGAYSGDVYALSPKDRSVRWMRELDGPIIAGLAASETVVYAATDAGTLHALDAEDGGEIGRFDAGDSVWGAPLLVEGDLYVASVNGKLFKLDAESLEPAWDAPFEVSQGLISDPVLADGTVLVGGIDRHLYAVDATTGEQREGWPFKGGNWFWGRPLVLNGIVYAPNLDGRLHALDLETGEEQEGWPFEAEDPDPMRSVPVLAGGVLVVVDRGGNVYGLDPEDGALQWSSSGEDGLKKTVLSNPLVRADDEAEEGTVEVLISAQGGDLFGVDPTAGASVEVPTP